ncbi:MAG: AAA-type ATPase lid domain-containing protein [Deferrisomatales bacterium]
MRDHPEDIPLLAQSLWKTIAGAKSHDLPESITNSLCGYSWPGNVRELKMVLTHLHGLFGSSAPLEERHLRAVFAMQGQQTPLQPPRRDVLPSPPMERFAAFRRLRRTCDTVRAAEHLLKPLLLGSAECIPGADLEDQICLLLDELDALCRHPLSYTPKTFESLGVLRSRLSYFVSRLEDDPDQALAYLRETGRDAFDLALASLQGESDAALASL